MKSYEIHHVPRQVTRKKYTIQKTPFLRNALSSKNPNEAWETVNRILDPPKNRIKYDSGDLNRYYTELASTLTNNEILAFDQSLLANIIPEIKKDNTFVT